MRILVSNDDGIYNPGIAALAGAAQRFGEVRVVFRQALLGENCLTLG